jgi:hypothetical protein
MRQSLNPQLVKYACQVLPLQRVYYVFHVPHTSLSMLSWSFTCHLLLWSGTHGLKIETVDLNASVQQCTASPSEGLLQVRVTPYNAIYN